MKAGKVHGKSEDDGQDSGEGHKSGKKGQEERRRARRPQWPSSSPQAVPPARPAVTSGTGGRRVSDEQKQAFAKKMRTGTPAERRDMINQIPDAAMRNTCAKRYATKVWKSRIDVRLVRGSGRGRSVSATEWRR